MNKKILKIDPRNNSALLMGAGPVPVRDEVLEAQKVLINHIGDSMNQVLSEIQEMSRYVFQTSSSRIFGISGPASASMEMAVSNLVWPGRKVLILNLGTFSYRFSEMILGLGGEVKVLTPVADVFTPEEVKRELDFAHYDLLTIVHGETSCGRKNIHLQEICEVAHQKNVLTLVDGVTTISTMPFFMDEWKIDVAFTAGQKGLSAVPGVSLIAFSERAFEEIEKRKYPQTHWCLDARRANRFWNHHEYHYTAPVTNLMALHEALRLITEETLERRFFRHEFFSALLQESLQTMGLDLFASQETRLNSVLAVKNLQGVVVKDLLKVMRTVHQVEISGAFGLDIFRIGQMGEQCRRENVRRVIESLGKSLEFFGKHLEYMKALEQFDKKTSHELNLNAQL